MKKLLTFLFVLSLVSCASKKDVLYFQDIEGTELAAMDSIAIKTEIQTNDVLNIRITAENPKSILPFLFKNPGSGEGVSINRVNNMDILRLKGYLVDQEGNISFPQFGEIHVAGKTPEQLEEDLTKHLSVYVKNPTVSVRIINFKVTVLGAVKQPGTFKLSGQHITLPQALGLAGDLDIHGQRENVLVIRNIGGKRIYKHIDLTQSDWMNSPFYYLKQNDIVYVKPNGAQAKKAGFIGSIGSVLSVASILLSAAVIIFR